MDSLDSRNRRRKIRAFEADGKVIVTVGDFKRCGYGIGVIIFRGGAHADFDFGVVKGTVEMHGRGAHGTRTGKQSVGDFNCIERFVIGISMSKSIPRGVSTQNAISHIGIGSVVSVVNDCARTAYAYGVASSGKNRTYI